MEDYQGKTKESLDFSLIASSMLFFLGSFLVLLIVFKIV